MTRDQVRDLFRHLGVWQRKGKRAPYKPLLVLAMLGRYAAGGDRVVSYRELDEQLLALFKAFAPPRRTFHTEYPFWYLQNDQVWEVIGAEEAKVRKGKASQPTKSQLLKHGAAAGIPRELYAALRSDPLLLRDVAVDLLESHFPETMHEEVLSAVGLELSAALVSRDPRFRAEVLRVYGFRCAICGFDARMGDALVGLEAAHIRWHQAGGPAVLSNGLALCSLHHRLFDRGAFTLTADGRVEVSQHLNGGPATEAVLTRFHSLSLRRPDNPADAPNPGYVSWHRREVFRSPGKWMAA